MPMVVLKTATVSFGIGLMVLYKLPVVKPASRHLP